MSEEPRATFLAAIPVSFAARLGLDYPVKPGFTPDGSCATCGERLWIGPKIRALADSGTPVYCPLCLAASGLLEADCSNVRHLGG